MADTQAQIARLLDLARRARRLAPHFDDDDRARLLKHAEELEQEAAALRRSVCEKDGGQGIGNCGSNKNHFPFG